jgi:hypothetical protein
MQLEQNANLQQQKQAHLKKDAISSIDWSLDSRKIVVCFKLSQVIVVWDIVTCERLFQLDFSQNLN